MFRKYLEGLRDSLTIVIGYLPVALVFGMTSHLLGFSMIEATLASALIFAGMSQFILISLINISPLYAIFLASIVNLRHLIYGCMIAKKCNIGKRTLPFIALGLTDEVFVLAISKDNITEHYIIGLVTGSYLSWIIGTVIGVALGEEASIIGIASSLAFALTILFIAILALYVRSLRDIVVILYSTIITVLLCLHGLGQIAPLVVLVVTLLVYFIILGRVCL